VSVALVPEVLLLCAYLLVPGAGLCLSTRVSIDRSVFTFLALAFALGFAAVGSISLVLALLGMLDPVILALCWIVGSAGTFIASRRRSLRAHTHGWTEDIHRSSWEAAAAALVIVSAGIARWLVSPVTAIGPTVPRYWADALEIADAGGIPGGTLQWGTILPPITSKVVLNSFNAGVSMLLGRDLAASQAALLFVATVGLVITAIALFKELGIRRLAPLGGLLLFLNHAVPNDLVIDLGRNLAEDWGRLVAFAAVLAWCLARPAPAGEEFPQGARDPRIRAGPIAVSGLLLGVSAGTHLVAMSFGIAAICALGISSLLIEGGRVVSIATTGAILGIALLLGGVILWTAPGELGFGGASGGDPYRDLRSSLGLPAAFDPTRFITTHDVDAAEKVEQADVADVASEFAYKVRGAKTMQIDSAERLSALSLAIPTILALLCAVLVLAIGPTSLRVVAVSAVILASALFLVGLAFALRYDEFALQAFGFRRLFSYAIVPHVLAFAAAGEALAMHFGRRDGGTSIVVAVAVTVAAVLAVAPVREDATSHPWTSQLALVRWLGRHVPCEGRVLMDRRTLGTFEAIAGRAGVLEGMGPHLRPEVLELAIGEIFRARSFFDRPEEGRRYLRHRSVAAVVITRATPRVAMLGYRIAHLQPQRMDRVPYLTPRFRNAAGSIYLVDGFEPNPASPLVAGRPGYGCQGARASIARASTTRSTSSAVW
jgi:hypothetical protein